MYAPFYVLVNMIGDEIKSEVRSPLYLVHSEHHPMVGPLPKFFTKPDLVWLADLIFLLNEGLIETLNQEQSTPIDCFLKEKWIEVSSELHRFYNSSSSRRSPSYPDKIESINKMRMAQFIYNIQVEAKRHKEALTSSPFLSALWCSH